MKKLPDHVPRASAWEDLLKRGEFESQLTDHLPTLPRLSPPDTAWERITVELDRQKEVTIWIRWSAAAAVVAILLFSLVDLNSTNDHIQEQELTAERVPDTKTDFETTPSESITTAEIVELSTDDLSPAIAGGDKPERFVRVIEAPKMTLPEVVLSQSKSISLERPETQMQESVPPKTLHQVSISWNKIKPGLQVKTSFGRAEAELEPKQQASTGDLTPLKVDIYN